MKKKIIALSIAFVLVAIAAIGTTLAYLTDKTGTVANKVAIGNITIDAVELVNHTNAAGTDKDNDSDEIASTDATYGAEYAGYKKIELGETGTQEHAYSNVLPGDKLAKVVEIKNTSANPAIFAVSAKVDLPVDALTDGAWGSDKAIVTAMPTEAEFLGLDTNVSGKAKDANIYTFAAADPSTFIFYYYVPGNSSTTVNLSASVPVDVNNNTISTYNDKSITVFVSAIQADGFEDTKAGETVTKTAVVKAIEALNTAINPITGAEVAA